MRIATWKHLLRLELAVLYGLAMVLLPLAHQPMRATVDEVAVVTMDDGSTVEICTSAKGRSGKTQTTSCDACRLTSAPGLVTAKFAPLIAHLRAPERIAIAGEQLPRMAIEHSLSQPRAPPFRLA